MPAEGPTKPGATWNSVLFGLLQGLLLVGHRACHGWCGCRPRLRALLETAPGLAGRVALTFFVFCLSLVIFRSPELATAGRYFARLLTPAPDGLSEPLPAFAFVLVALLVVAGHALARGGPWKRLARRLPPAVLGAGYGVALSLVLLLAPPAGQGFIYFQF